MTRTATDGAAAGQAAPTWRMVRRQRVLLAVAVAAAVVCAGGLAASTLIKSPAQVAAEQSPPPASVLTAKVQSMTLTQAVTVRGTVTSPASTPVRALTSGAGGLRVVTATPKAAGDMVDSGQVMLEISGRPLFVLAGSRPAYRDLTVNTRGADVTQAQQNLVSLGLLDGAGVTGRFDWATQVAVARLYKDAGYETVGQGSSVSLPLSEYVFVADLPATVAKVAVGAGQTLASGDEPVMTLNTGELLVDAVVPSGQQVGLATGQGTQVTDDVAGKTVDGTLTAIGPYRQASSGAGDETSAQQAGYPVTIQPTAPLDASWLGANVLVRITGVSSDGPVLAVPATAVVSEASGDVAVFVRHADGSTERVAVRTGMVVDGMVEATPVVDGALAAGDDVVTG